MINDWDLEGFPINPTQAALWPAPIQTSFGINSTQAALWPAPMDLRRNTFKAFGNDSTQIELLVN